MPDGIKTPKNLRNFANSVDTETNQLETTQKEWNTTRKVVSPRSKYAPLEMTDAAVFDMARHWYSATEIASAFNVTPDTLLEHHGEAYRAGKANGMQKPRMLLDRVFNAFASLDEQELARGDVPVATLLQAIKLHAQKYEGLGSKQTIVHEGTAQYDGVISAPDIIEKP